MLKCAVLASNQCCCTIVAVSAPADARLNQSTAPKRIQIQKQRIWPWSELRPQLAACVPGLMQSQRDCALQPRVARNELPWVEGQMNLNPEGVPPLTLNMRIPG